ncbi:DUF4114 domain-containing protein [Flavisolibacter ginsenosidimutans]|uniref:DUF4114 domain-containing protein n=1 Tax=Flavisolibacter ginsenosidimutans TaxID=661481 RepID=A0A5B8ULX5_9BACT|nr:DUF4114 domain-containing protein [Flavisolibacter ginsenosidimutans]QEC57025.1 DUF4114 domain-containing protein [Flavisolibacter ginsenosidimutans]
MKMKSTLFFAALAALVSCKKTEATSDGAQSKPVSFTDTFYENVCTWDASGRPDCLMAPDTISAALFNFMNLTLPEGKDLRNTNPSLLSSNATADIALTQASDVYITFLYQATSSNNAFGYYTFPTGQAPKTASDIKKITYVFPNVKSNSPLQPGDKVKIGHFDAGTSIGLVLLQSAWQPAAKKPDNNAIHFCSNDALNPEVDANLKKHAVLVNYAAESKLLIGFEDADRATVSCDHDFNDVVLYATVVH